MAYDMPPEGSIIGGGISGVVYALDDFHVLKAASGFLNSRYDLMIECRIYERLRGQPCILHFWRDPRGLILERLFSPLRPYLRYLHGQRMVISADLLFKWADQVFNGLWSMHSKGVLQADIGCHNLLLHRYYNNNGQLQWDLKFCDFGGASIDGGRPTVNYEIRSRHPTIRGPNFTTELFALGTLLYEMSTSHPPHPMVETDDSVPSHLYTLGMLPNVNHLLLGHIIRGCWKSSYESILDVAVDMNDIRSQYRESHST